MDRFAFETLLQSAAGDGDGGPTGVMPAPRADFEELLRAWSIERSHSIECEFLLQQSRAAITRLLAANPIRTAPDQLRPLRTLLRQIEAQLDAGPRDRA